MIDYIEKGPGLHQAIRAAGHWLREENGVFVSSDDAVVQAIIDGYTLEQARAVRKSESLLIAKTLRDKVIADTSPGEIGGWAIKLSEAAKYALSGNPADAPLLSAEAAYRGISLEVMLSKVSANATYFAQLEAAIAGADGKHRDAISLLPDFSAVVSYDLTVGWPAV